jgi:hypothetical protein
VSSYLASVWYYIFIKLYVYLTLDFIFVGVAGEAIALGFQHYILSLGTAVMIPTMLVPLMGGNDVRISSLLLLCSSLDSLISLVKQILTEQYLADYQSVTRRKWFRHCYL